MEKEANEKLPDRRQQIMNLLKNFHPDSLGEQSSDVQSDATRITQILNVMRTLDESEEIPEELRHEDLYIVFRSDEGKVICSKKKTSIPSKQKDFLDMLNYAVNNGSLSAESSEEETPNTDPQQAVSLEELIKIDKNISDRYYNQKVLKATDYINLKEDVNKKAVEFLTSILTQADTLPRLQVTATNVQNLYNQNILKPIDYINLKGGILKKIKLMS